MEGRKGVRVMSAKDEEIHVRNEHQRHLRHDQSIITRHFGGCMKDGVQHSFRLGRHITSSFTVDVIAFPFFFRFWRVTLQYVHLDVSPLL